ncbi:MAG TPA: 50S ribosomal protein L3 [Bacilli bacterium]|jgi:large subunit ribosomal protein L3|nr:50S ribosomal protein L3 [Acholeplasmataceae bacterium]HNZ77430.1 50S ribosomal protein L3 [Bacilli bacterium]HOD61583.1 50S ribosomal protein L3 [Bacilli bacterium]HOH61635.1 50S ribosomal protein L3 [Bacilli bacterium]HPB48839.1 50S ribosomal protein L3 [Bacilli bacterium]
MAKGILGKKIGMTQVFSAQGELVPVTVIEVAGNIVLQKKTADTDGYQAVQLGFADKKKNRVNNPEKGHAAKAQTNPKRFIKEIAGEEMAVFEVGQEVKANIFAEGDIVDVTGTSKGKGYQGVIKRWNFHRGPAAHGSGYHRGTGSMGAIGISIIRKGRKLAGRMGGEQVTVQNLEVIKIDLEKNVMLIKGNVPGAKNSFVIVTNAVKKSSAAINPEALA